MPIRHRLDRLHRLGFDRSTHDAPGPAITVRCSQCEALVISGTPTHESGCPNAVHECHGCSTLVPARQRYCDDCSMDAAAADE